MDTYFTVKLWTEYIIPIGLGIAATGISASVGTI